MPISVNKSAFPLTVHPMEGLITAPELEAYLKELDKLLAAKKPFVTIVPVGQISRSIDRRLVKLHAEWFEKNRSAVERYWLGLVLFFRNSLLARFLFSSMLLLVKLPLPYLTTSDSEEAISWAKEALQKNGLSLPEGTRIPL